MTRSGSVLLFLLLMSVSVTLVLTTVWHASYRMLHIAHARAQYEKQYAVVQTLAQYGVQLIADHTDVFTEKKRVEVKIPAQSFVQVPYEATVRIEQHDDLFHVVARLHEQDIVIRATTCHVRMSDKKEPEVVQWIIE